MLTFFSRRTNWMNQSKLRIKIDKIKFCRIQKCCRHVYTKVCKHIGDDE